MNLNIDDTVKGAREIATALRTIDIVEPLIKNHPFSGRFLEIRSLMSDLHSLEKLEVSRMRDVLITDIKDYLNNDGVEPLKVQLLTSLNEIESLKEQLKSQTIENELLREKLAKTAEQASSTIDTFSVSRNPEISKRLTQLIHDLRNVGFLQSVSPTKLADVLEEILDLL